MNKVAVVTGGARGIGMAVAKKFLSQGDKVAILDLDAAVVGDAYSLRCDVSNPQQVKTSIDSIVARFGRIDALVNNAGIAVFKPLLETTYEEWTRVLDVNLTGPFLCTQACAPVMLRTAGGMTEM